METLPHDWLALAVLVFMLGLKHGFDADHLATIDGLTRFNARANAPLARWCGALFSLGHGAVVIAIAVTVGALAARWTVPGWVEDLGAWVSIGFLTALGVLNLRAVLAAAPHELVQPVGLRGRLFARLQRATHPLAVALVGAFFAISFDTMSQAALFALTASQFGGWGHALTLGLLFMGGMLVTDGVNGLWIARLIRRADQVARLASRVMGLTIAGLSLLVAAFGALKYFAPAIDRWSEGKEIAFGALVLVAMLASFLLAVQLARLAPRKAWAGDR